MSDLATLTPEEAADVLHCSASLVRKECAAGRLPHRREATA